MTAAWQLDDSDESFVPQRPSEAAPDALREARMAELRLYRQLLRESRLRVPEWSDDGSGPTASWALLGGGSAQLRGVVASTYCAQ